MGDTVGKGVPADACGLGNQQVLVLTRVDTLRENRCVGLILMDGTQVCAQHPHSRVEPLQSGERVNEDQVPRVVQADVSPFMSKNSGIMGLIVLTVHDDIVHPTEGRQRCVTGHADSHAIRLRMLLALPYQQNDSDHRQQGVSQRRAHTYYK